MRSIVFITLFALFLSCKKNSDKPDYVGTYIGKKDSIINKYNSVKEFVSRQISLGKDEDGNYKITSNILYNDYSIEMKDNQLMIPETRTYGVPKGWGYESVKGAFLADKLVVQIFYEVRSNDPLFNRTASVSDTLERQK